MALSESDRGWGMKGVELYARERFAVQIEGVSQREAARRFGIDPRTVAKMLAFSVPPDTGGAGRQHDRSWTGYRDHRWHRGASSHVLVSF
jgi:hypothetical protein